LGNGFKPPGSNPVDSFHNVLHNATAQELIKKGLIAIERACNAARATAVDMINLEN
jgi:hypothetical protein